MEDAEEMSLSFVRFKQVDLADPFFDSLKAEYAEFKQWFSKKADEMAYLSKSAQGVIDGFLYLKIEDEAHPDIIPALEAKHRLKVGTFKIDAHGTKLGDRFVKKLFDRAMADHVEEIYLTIFEKHSDLIKMLKRYGFKPSGIKTSSNGTESVYIRTVAWKGDSLNENYPLVRVSTGSKYLLALYPQWHTRLLPDSKLIREGPDVVVDISHTNSIQKIYLAGRSDAQYLKHGDALVIYRTSDNQGPAHYRSVATSVCVVDRVKMIDEYPTETAFLEYCKPFSVFTKLELKEFYKSRQYPVVITFTYNISFPKRVTRKVLIEEIGLDGNERWSCLKLSNEQFLAIMKKDRWMKVLLSIKPQYAEKIFAGSKRYEFRKTMYKNPEVNTVVVYATRPVGKVIGEFSVSDVHCDSPKRLWQKTKDYSGITENFFQEYFAKRKVGFAIEVGIARRYPTPLDLADVSPNGFAPQSFAYLPSA
jgi:predicted transcriptional regulator